MLYGTLVLETIEDIHKAVLRCEQDAVTEENIQLWFYANYATLVKKEHMYLHASAQKAALKQVLAYAKKRRGNWDDIREAESGVTLVKDKYIINGKIDLIRGDDGALEILDFKSEKKPDPVLGKECIDKYRRQLQIYVYLISQNTGKKISRMRLYYTGEETDPDPTITFEYNDHDIEETTAMFDRTAKKIKEKEF